MHPSSSRICMARVQWLEARFARDARSTRALLMATSLVIGEHTIRRACRRRRPSRSRGVLRRNYIGREAGLGMGLRAQQRYMPRTGRLLTGWCYSTIWATRGEVSNACGRACSVIYASDGGNGGSPAQSSTQRAWTRADLMTHASWVDQGYMCTREV